MAEVEQVCDSCDSGQALKGVADVRRPMSSIVRGALRGAYLWSTALGLNPLATWVTLTGMPKVWGDYRELRRQQRVSSTTVEFPLGSLWPVFGDWKASAGVASGHYFHQDLLVAREVFKRNPRRHIDVGSSVSGFVAHVASFRDVEVMDVRPLESKTPGITFVQQDVMNLSPGFVGIADSVSCLHALEHFGLGRYGDPVDIDGWRKGLDALTLMLEPGGTLYLSVPTGGEQRTEFNAHRVFALPFLRNELSQRLGIERLAFVKDDLDLIADADPWSLAAESSFGSRYGCSIWVLRKN